MLKALKNHHTHAPMTIKAKCRAWCELVRLDKPVGTELLLYPTLWSLFLAYASIGRLPPIKMLFIFALGAVFMRAAGCAINDFADRRVDGRVKRTQNRPLADGRLSAKTAVATFVILVLLSAVLLIFLPIQVFYWSLLAVALAFIYPFMKRVTHLPQVVLAAAFGMAIPMAFVASLGQTTQMTWLLFVAYMCWTVAYDTEYAMCDKDDDLKIGVKSTAILFGSYDKVVIALLQGLFVLLMGWAMYPLLDWFVFVVIAPMIRLFIYQQRLIYHRQRLLCFQAFLHNVLVGRWAIVAIVIGCVLVLTR